MSCTKPFITTPPSLCPTGAFYASKNRHTRFRRPLGPPARRADHALVRRPPRQPNEKEHDGDDQQHMDKGDVPLVPNRIGLSLTSVCAAENTRARLVLLRRPRRQRPPCAPHRRPARLRHLRDAGLFTLEQTRPGGCAQCASRKMRNER